MKQLEYRLRKFLQEMSADLIGIGDVADLAPDSYPRVIAIAKALPLHVLEQEVPNGPTQEYVDCYRQINHQLDAMANAAELMLQQEGYRALALSRRNINWDRVAFSTPLPYKTCATRAGLGWIGKCALLVTPEFGSGIRLTAVLTDAPFPVAEPVLESRCGGCTSCVDICPAGAITNTLWHTGVSRAELVDVYRCDQIARAIAEEKLGERTTMCGKCFAACPYTKAYIRRAKVHPAF